MFCANSISDRIETKDFLNDVGRVLKLVELIRVTLEHFESRIYALGEDRIVLLAQFADNFGVNGQPFRVLTFPIHVERGRGEWTYSIIVKQMTSDVVPLPPISNALIWMIAVSRNDVSRLFLPDRRNSAT